MEDFERGDLEIERVLAEIGAECKHPYHNARHTREVVDRVRQFADHVMPPLSDDERKLLVRAALYHDYGHPGKTIRQTSSENIPRRDLSNEEYAAGIAVERFAAGSEDQRSILRKLILATSFGQNDPKSPFYRSYKPETRLEKVLALADIGGFTKGFESWVDEGLGGSPGSRQR